MEFLLVYGFSLIFTILIDSRGLAFAFRFCSHSIAIFAFRLFSVFANSLTYNNNILLEFLQIFCEFFSLSVYFVFFALLCSFSLYFALLALFLSSCLSTLLFYTFDSLFNSLFCPLLNISLLTFILCVFFLSNFQFSLYISQFWFVCMRSVWL